MIHLIGKDYFKFFIQKIKYLTKVIKRTLHVEVVGISNLNHA